MRAGLELDMGEKLSGEILGRLAHGKDSTTTGWRRFGADRRTPTSNGRPSAAPTIGLSGATTWKARRPPVKAARCSIPAASPVERQIRANLTGNAALGVDWRNYTGSDGHEMILNAEAGLTWWLNRYAGLTTRVGMRS